MATIVGTILQSTGAGRRETLTFSPLSTPQSEGGSIITSTQPRVVTSASDGAFSIQLEQGDYKVSIGTTDTVQISVPNNGNTLQFTSLLTQSLTYTYTQPHGSGITASDTFTGDGSTTAFTLSAAPGHVRNILVSVGGQVQPPSSYSLATTTLTFTTAPANNATIEVRHFGLTSPGTATISSAGLVRTNSTSANPVVYRKEEVDSLLNNLSTTRQSFTQSTATATWGPFSHNLGFRPQVSVFDTSGNAVTAEVIASSSAVTLKFNAALAGSVELR